MNLYLSQIDGGPFHGLWVIFDDDADGRLIDGPYKSRQQAADEMERLQKEDAEYQEEQEERRCAR